jgi:hypothetical protein
MALAKNKLPTKELILKHMKNGIVQLSLGEDLDDYSLIRGTIPDQLAKVGSANPYGAPDTEFTAFNITKNKWVTFQIEDLVEYKGRVKRYVG